MATSYTSLLGLALPVTGELSGTWGDTVNNYITNYLDAAVAGVQIISGSQTAVTLSVTNGSSLVQVGAGATGSAQYGIIRCSGNPASLLTITAPAASKSYLIINATSTSQSVKIVGTGPTTGVTLVSGESAVVAWNGTDFIKVSSSAVDGVSTFSAGTTGFTPSTATSGAVTLAGTLATTNGGTGLTSFTANRVFYSSSTSAIDQSANLTFDGTTLTANALTTTSTVTINGGTANGVAYLDGSKVLTTGSALTFDGTNLGIGANITASAAAAPSFTVGTGSGNPAITLYSATTGSSQISFADATSGAGAYDGYVLYNQNNQYMVFGIAATEAMRLTSTGLGIGTSSPAQKLDVNGDARVGNATAGTNRQLSINGVVSKASRIAFQESGTDRWLIGNGAASENGNFEIYDATNGNNFVLTRAGNLGLGVTPSAWATSGTILKALQIGAAGSISAGTVDASIHTSQNAYFDGTSWRYIQTATAGNYYISGNSHVWRIAPSGTAGNAITFSQVMTLDASGNLALGHTSTPSTRLDVRTSLSATANPQWVSDFYAITSGSTDGTYGGGIRLWTKNLNGNYWPAAVAAINDAGGSNLSALGFYTATSGPTLNERARITSGGDFYIGDTTAPGSELFLVKKNQGAAYIQRVWNTATSGDNGFVVFATETANADRGSITYNRAGGLVAYNTTSDYRAKDILGPVADPGAVIDALKVYTGKMKGATIERPMLIAHEAQDVAPYAVTGEKDAVNESGDPIFQQMDVSSLVPLLIAEIQSLRQRVAQLEGK